MGPARVPSDVYVCVMGSFETPPVHESVLYPLTQCPEFVFIMALMLALMLALMMALLLSRSVLTLLFVRHMTVLEGSQLQRASENLRRQLQVRLLRAV